jgi:hypothetical protein
MPKLDYIGLGDKVSEAGINAFILARPNLEMDY